MSDDDIRTALACAHEPAPPFLPMSTARPARSRAVVAVVALAVAAVMLVVVRPWSSAPAPITDARLAHAVPPDLSTSALSSTSLKLPLDRLLEVPGLAALGTMPRLTNPGGLP